VVLLAISTDKDFARPGRSRSVFDSGIISRRRGTGIGSKRRVKVSAGNLRAGSDIRCRNGDALLLKQALQVEDVFGRF
jgi:hypothetical protein